jgi:hypothetical protein
VVALTWITIQICLNQFGQKRFQLVYTGTGAALQDNIYVLSFNSLVAAYGPTLDTRLIFTIIRKSDMVCDTMDQLLQALSWSFNTALTGKSPERDWKNNKMQGGGVPLRDDIRFACCQCRGDWEFFSHVFHLPRWNEATQMCPFCRASSKIRHLAFTNTRPDAPWRRTIWSHATRMEYLRNAGLILPVLFVAMIGFTLECLHIDVLHTVDQGFSTHLVGNVFWHVGVVLSAFGGSTQKEKLNFWVIILSSGTKRQSVIVEFKARSLWSGFGPAGTGRN